MTVGPSRKLLTVLALLFVVPAIHPAFRPVLGPPSHLLWWVHVLPVAFFTFRHGRRGAVATLGISAVLVLVGERIFGAGWSTPAPWETAIALTVALLFTNVLVAAFALYARTVTARYQILFDRMTLPLLRTSADGTVRAANPAAEELLDRSQAELRGRPLDDLLVSPDADSAEELISEEGWTGRLELPGEEDGDPRPIHAFVVGIHDARTRGTQVLVVDRSLEVLQEEELERKSRLAALGEALAGVAHEIKNPLTAIIGHAQLGLLEGTPPAELREICQVVDREARRIQELVQELLGFSRSDRELRRTQIADLLRRVVRVQRVSQRDGIELRERIDYEGEVLASPTKVEQIVLNLVSNASDAVQTEGEGRVTVECCAVDGERVEIEVHDDGPGIDEDVLPTVFEPFVTTKPEGEGTGLGLAISRRLARSMDGSLEARNRPDGGASFVLSLPLAGNRSAGDGAGGDSPDSDGVPAPTGKAPAPG